VPHRFDSIRAAILIAALSFCPVPGFGIDQETAIEELVPGNELPRVLNSVDIPDLRPSDPQPLFSPTGDFNRDGVEDMAISGTFSLPAGKEPYFLCVATMLKDPIRYQLLHFSRFSRPFLAGTATRRSITIGT
jgi:hypothetical protein